MRFALVVATSEALSSTRSRLKKVEALADLLAMASRRELPVIVDYLSGRLPQGRIGLGPSMLYQTPGLFSADERLLEIEHVDERLSSLGRARPRGAVRHSLSCSREQRARSRRS